jgi:hypothetical protein
MPLFHIDHDTPLYQIRNDFHLETGLLLLFTMDNVDENMTYYDFRHTLLNRERHFKKMQSSFRDIDILSIPSHFSIGMIKEMILSEYGLDTSILDNEQNQLADDLKLETFQTSIGTKSIDLVWMEILNNELKCIEFEIHKG